MNVGASPTAVTSNQQVVGSSPIGGSILYRAPKVMRYVAAGLYPAIRGSTPRGCTNLKGINSKLPE